jgi:ATP phosphoribosyltransferase regulatory subunit
MMSLSPAAARAVELIERSGGARVELPTVLPARTLLEVAGEGMRARLCLFQDDRGRDLCLRPEMTTPIAEQVAQGKLVPGRYVYAGDVFRLPLPGSNDAIEFPQAGFEWFGGGDVDQDVDAAMLAFDAGVASSAVIVLGDVALYRAVVDGLGFSPVWKDRLKRSFSRARGPLAVLSAAGQAPKRDASALARILTGLSEADAQAVIDEMMQLAGVEAAARRPAAEIAERLRERASAQPPADVDASSLGAYLSLQGPADGAVKRLRALEATTKIKIGDALVRFEQRLARLASHGVDLSKALFDPELGRRFEYYDGFVFEVRREGDPTRAILSGGRYDGLVQRLKPGAAAMSAIGASLRLDRLEA